jgi:hypothetical protein
MLFMVVGIVCSHRGLAVDLPPIDWSGRIGLLLRTSQPENGDDTFQQSYTGEITGRSIVWEPWFGNWRARLAASESLTDSTTDQDATILSGDGQLNLFPKSRFPFEAFFDVQDTRVDINESERPGIENRFVRYGIRQRYQTPVGDTYNATVLRDHREDLVTGRRDTSNRAIMSGLLQRGAHRINGAFLANGTRTELGNEERPDGVPGLSGDNEQLDWQLDVTDTYTPDSRFSLATTGTVGYSDAQTETDSSETRRARVTSQLLWRAANVPVRVRGDFLAGSQRTESDDVLGDRDEEEVRGTVNLSYLPTPRWRLGLEGGGAYRGGELEETTTFQAVTVDYSSLPIPFVGFDYTYGASLGARNETNSRTESEQLYFVDLLHELNRRWLFDLSVPVALGLNLGQELRVEDRTLLGNLNTLVNRLALNLSSQASSAQLLVRDSRNSGRNDVAIQTVSLTGVHNQRLSRFSNFAANYSLNWTRQSGSVERFEVPDDPLAEDPADPFQDDLDDTRRAETTSLELTYRHSRLFWVRNLFFQSRLRLSADSLLVSDFVGSDSDNGELLWENRVDYFIGKLEVRFRTALIERSASESGNRLAVLSIIRRF